jgi:Uma2 family endonuclease
MALPRTLTVDDLYAMPESKRGERYELIDGEFLVIPAQRGDTRRLAATSSFAYQPMSARCDLAGYVTTQVFMLPSVTM